MTIDVNLTLNTRGYAPDVLNVPVGTTIRFRNSDGFAHTATLIPGAAAFPDGSPFNVSAQTQSGSDVSKPWSWERSRRVHLHNRFSSIRREPTSMDVSIITARRCKVPSLHSKRRSAALTFAVTLLLALPCTQQAQAIPIFAQRYRLQCGACHSVLPELNMFGRYFRAHGYRLDAPKHGTTGIALRYQMEYETDPAAGSRRFTPGGVLLSNADIGAVSAFIHYNLGAGGGPAGLFLGYLSRYDAHTQTTYRAGLFELPLAQSPGQRLDDLASYGYYGTHVGLNDLPLSSPRWGLQAERVAGSATFDLVLDRGEFKGAAYGGKPLDTGEDTSPASPASRCLRVRRWACTLKPARHTSPERATSPQRGVRPLWMATGVWDCSRTHSPSGSISNRSSGGEAMQMPTDSARARGAPGAMPGSNTIRRLTGIWASDMMPLQIRSSRATWSITLRSM